MIDTDKMKAAFAATPLCQRRWTQTGDDGGATKLCAISALVSFAGVQPELIAKMERTEREATIMQTATLTLGQVPRWVADLALPVLWAEYGIPRGVGVQFPPIFDAQENEYKGMLEVLALCEKHNMDERHADALTENALRFPQESPVGGMTWYGTDSGGWLTVENYTITCAAVPVTHLSDKPKGQTDTGKSKFWTASKKPNVPKLLKV